MTPDTQALSEHVDAVRNAHPESGNTDRSQAAPDLPSALALRQEKESREKAERADASIAAAESQAALSSLAAKLPIQLDLRIALPTFRVQNLLSLEKGMVIETVWPHTEDLPLWIGSVQLVWSEFEVLDQKLAVRITRLA